MADMIIKPSSGNSLVFQDEGGDAALTVGTTGNTTLAGTANNLGTVTAGSIAGGAITDATTFPAGHIITMATLEPSGTVWTGDSDYTECTNYEISIIKKQSTTSKIILNCSFPWQGYWAGSSGYAYQSSGYTKWVRDAPTAWTSPLFRNFWADEMGSDTHWNMYSNLSNGFVDTSTATGTHTYTMWVSADDEHNKVSSYSGFIQIMEVTI